MKRLIIVLTIVFTGCAGRINPLQVSGTSHDSLALAQDIEAQICWGVADAYSAPKDSKIHCTAPLASTIGLTDARHKDINTKLSQAFLLHRSLNSLAESGGNVDYTALNALIQEVLAIVAQLQQAPQVVQLANAVKAGGK